MTALSPIVSRSLAVTLLVAVGFGIWTLVVEPLQARFEEYDRSIAQSQELLTRYLRIAQARPALESERDTQLLAQEDKGQFLSGESVELVSAQVQNRVKALMDAQGGALKSMQILTPNADGSFRKVSLRVNLIADTAALQAILYDLETASPYFFLDNVDIRSRRRRSSRNKGVERDQLQVRFDVYGYMRSAVQ